MLRRAAGLVLLGAGRTGLLGALALVLGGAVARAGERFGWQTSRAGPLPAIGGTLVVLAVPAAMLTLLGERLAQQSATTRLLVAILIGLVAALSGWVAARRLFARPGGRLVNLVRTVARPPVVATTGAVLLVGALAVRPPDEPVHAAPRDAVDPAMQAAPDVLLVVVDGLRADAPGCYGGETHTPHLDALAARGTLFEDARAPSAWALPSVASLFTSSHPWRHGCDERGRVIDPGLATLAERLHAAGYRCVASVGNPLVDDAYGFGRGFDAYDAYAHEFESRLFVPRLLDATLRFLGRVDGEPGLDASVLGADVNGALRTYARPADDRPTFLYFHYGAPGANDAAGTDRALGELLEELAQTRRPEETLIVVTASHGADRRELGREVVHIPLVLAGPGVARGLRVSGCADLLDVAPTVLELVGVATPPSFAGRSLAPLFRAGAEFEERPSFAELSAPDARSFSVDYAGWRILRRTDLAGRVLSQEVYDLASDPDEEHPVADPPPELEPVLEALEVFAGRPRRAPAPR